MKTDSDSHTLGRFFLLLLLFAVILLAGCPTQNTGGNGGNQNVPVTPPGQGTPTGASSEKIIFNPPAVLPEATDYTNYSYSFCKPEPAGQDYCGDYERAGTTTEPTGGKGIYMFKVQPDDSKPYGNALPHGIYLSGNGVLKGKPFLEGNIPMTYPFTVCVENDNSKLIKNLVCKSTSITVKPKIPKVNYTVSITTDAAGFSECVSGEPSSLSGGFTFVANGTMSSNVPFREGGIGEVGAPGAGDRAPAVHFGMRIADSKGRELFSQVLYSDNLDCGEWKAVGEGFSLACEKQAGDPDTATWRVTYSRSTYDSEKISVYTYIQSYNPNYYDDYSSTTVSTLNDRTESPAGTC